MNRIRMMFFSTLFLLISQNVFGENGQEPPPSMYGNYQGIIIIGVGLLFMYFILWRPEQKRRKALEEQRSSLKKGDKVTAVGIVGHIEKIHEHTVILKMVDGNKIEVLKAAISDVMSSEEEASSAQEGKE